MSTWSPSRITNPSRNAYKFASIYRCVADLNQAKNIGGVGAILTILSFLPYIGRVFSIIGLIFLLLSLKWISEIVQML